MWDNEEYFVKDELGKTDRQKRIEICKHCENLNNLYFCKLCNCFMPIKTWMKYKSCPIEKW